MKYTEATLSTRKLSRFEIREMLIAVLSDNFVGVIYYRPNFRHTLSFPVPRPRAFLPHAAPCRTGGQRWNLSRRVGGARRDMLDVRLYGG